LYRRLCTKRRRGRDDDVLDPSFTAASALEGGGSTWGGGSVIWRPFDPWGASCSKTKGWMLIQISSLKMRPYHCAAVCQREYMFRTTNFPGFPSRLAQNSTANRPAGLAIRLTCIVGRASHPVALRRTLYLLFKRSS
jgi:hypothetical protein